MNSAVDITPLHTLWVSHFIHVYAKSEFTALSKHVAYLKLGTYEKNDPSQIAFPKDPLKSIHYTWISKGLEKTTKQEQILICSCLPQEIKDPLSKCLNIDKEVMLEPSPWLSSLIHKRLRKEIIPPYITPKELLPSSSLDFLLNYPKDKLVELISLLGIADLSAELKNILHAAVFKTIKEHLSIKQRHYLEYCLRARNSIHLKNPLLIPLAKTPESLLKTLHLKGLERLALITNLKNKDFNWYLITKLDYGRGSLLRSKIQPEVPQKVQNTIAEQIVFLHQTYFKG